MVKNIDVINEKVNDIKYRKYLVINEESGIVDNDKMNQLFEKYKELFAAYDIKLYLRISLNKKDESHDNSSMTML